MTQMIFNNASIRRSAIAIAISLCFSSAVMAQGSEGSIFGKTTPKTHITITNVETGANRQLQSEDNGSFTLSKLPPGTYKVVVGASSREVKVRSGSGTEVKLDEPDTVVIQGSRTRAAIDMSSTESTSVFTQAELQALPVARDTTATVMLTAGSVLGDTRLGNHASIGGASVAENGYFVNGMDVTNIRNFLSHAAAPYDAIAETQVKTGGYGAEYGRSLGGVVAVTTKSGTNTWKGGISSYWTPAAAKAKGRVVAERDPDLIEKKSIWQYFNRYDSSGDVNTNLFIGGPIIKDKLFFFALASVTKSSTDGFGRDTSSQGSSTTPKSILKIDFNLTENHRFELTGQSDKNRRYSDSYSNLKKADVPGSEDQLYATKHIGEASRNTYQSSSTSLSMKYIGYLTDNLTVSATGGHLAEYGEVRTNLLKKNWDCPWVLGTGLEPLGCSDFTNDNNRGSLRENTAWADSDKRDSARLDLEYVLGAHTFKAGYDGQTVTASAAGFVNSSGGVYYRYFKAPTGAVNNVPNQVPPGSVVVRVRLGATGSGRYETINTAQYLQDTWKVNKDILLTTGLRWESFNNKNGDGVSFVKKDRLLAPRFGASWNVFGDGTTKVYGNIGRYFIPVASNTNVSASRFSYSNERFYTFSGMDPRTAAPLNLGKEVGKPNLSGSTEVPNPGTMVDRDLKPMSQDEFILGFQHALAKNLAGGVKIVHRKVNDGMDDFCGTKGIGNWMKDNGYTKFNPNTLASCILMNPGNDLKMNIDAENNKVLVPVTIPAKYLGLAKYSRTYDDVEFTLDRPFDGKWGLSGSYTWAMGKGTSEGYVDSNSFASNAGNTAGFDLGSFTDGAYGILPNLRRHAFKLYGNYAINENFSVGFNSSITSGRALSCLGGIPESSWDYLGASGTTNGGRGGYQIASSYYCLNGKFDTQIIDGKSVQVAQSSIVPRGSLGTTPWTKTLDVSATYKRPFAAGTFTLQLSIFNVLNMQTMTNVRQQGDYDWDTQLEGKRAPNFMSPSNFLLPRSVRLTGRYEF